MLHISAAAAEYVPALHWVQSADPCSEYLPASQMLHISAAAAEYVPELQVVQNSAAGKEDVPARQFLQTVVAPRLHVASNPA
jgi:hypothetical protein